MDVHPTRRSYGQEGGKGALVFAMSDGEVVGKYFVRHGEFCAADWCAVERRAAV